MLQHITDHTVDLLALLFRTAQDLLMVTLEYSDTLELIGSLRHADDNALIITSWQWLFLE